MSEKNKGLTVSYSAIDTYLSCSEKYRLERILKIIPEAINTAFFLGKAVDEASEVIFKPFMKGEKEYSRDEMISVFRDRLTNIQYQADIIYAPTSLLIKYSKADVQPELLEKKDLKLIKEFIDKSDLIIENIPNFIDYYKDTKVKVEDEKAIYNYIAWHCLFRKGIMMLDRLKQWADDSLLEVISIQRKIEIKNDTNDVLIGYLDLEAKMKSDGQIRTLDLKTASNPNKTYPDDKIATSMQLHIYAEATQKLVGYVILDKEVKKKEPRIRVRELYGEVTEEQLDHTFEQIDKAMNGIKAEKFEKNTEACYKFGICSFYNLCHRGDMKGLINKISNKPATIEDTNV